MKTNMARPAVILALAMLGWVASGAPALAGELRGRVVGADAASPAVVWIEGLPASPVPDRDTVITHSSGDFVPRVSIGFVGDFFVLRNEDDTLHNTHFYLRLAYQKEVSQRPLQYGRTLFNVALPKAGSEVRKRIEPHFRYTDATGFIEVACNPHPKENAYVLVFDHPYAAVTAADGTFSIDGIPAGEREVRFWKAGAVEKWKVVKIEDGAPLQVEIDTSGGAAPEAP